MSQANVDLIRRGFELFDLALGDDVDTAGEALAEMLEQYRPDADIDFAATTPGFPEGPAREALAAWIGDARETLDSWHQQGEQFIDAGDAVVAAVRVKARGRGSGAAVEIRYAYLFRFGDDQRITAARTFLALPEALEAAQRGAT